VGIEMKKNRFRPNRSLNRYHLQFSDRKKRRRKRKKNRFKPKEIVQAQQ
jgi:hypothetical protein